MLRYCQTKHALSACVDNELVILDVETGMYHHLNEQGRAIWEAISEPASIDEVVGQLATQFEATADQLRSDVMTFLTRLIDTKAVQIVAADAQ